MAQAKAAKKANQKSAKKPATNGRPSKGFTAEERAAMRERVKELKANGGKEDEERAVLEKLAAMAPADRALGERLHALIKATAPELSPRL